MACYHPWKPDPQLGLPPHIKLPCGQCIGCRLERSRQWAIRCMHEAQMHQLSCFVTLTYNEELVPQDYSLNHRHFQLFMKKLRKKYPENKIRYYMCGEYGTLFSRPHYHACLFGIDFRDKRPISELASRAKLYSSDELTRLWKHGYATLGAVTFQSAAYVARYVMKKITGDRASSHYTYIDNNGEIHSREPEYNRMSLRPGIGQPWYEKYSKDVYPSDEVIANGHASRPPRYYDKLHKRLEDAEHTRILKRRNIARIKATKDNTPQRLKAKETVTIAKALHLKRTIN